jgi:hypothetical protein
MIKINQKMGLSKFINFFKVHAESLPKTPWDLLERTGFFKLTKSPIAYLLIPA